MKSTRNSRRLPPLALSAALLATSALVSAASPAPGTEPLPTTSFASFDARAKAGAHLNVVFFGASLTWGANASNPEETSYRADIARKFEAAYPNAHFRFYDASIGGTGSSLGVFRLDRDVAAKHPDLVFLDFSANDGNYNDSADVMSSYESLVRRIITECRCPVEQVLMPFSGEISDAAPEHNKGRTARIALGATYHTGIGDVMAHIRELVANGKVKIGDIWPVDGVHPGDFGYSLFTDAAWAGYEDAVSKRLTCIAPDKPVYPGPYNYNCRVQLTRLIGSSTGWHAGIPNRTSAFFDMLMSRWLDDELIASVDATPLTLHFRGSFAMLLGESTMTSGKYSVTIDNGDAKTYDAGSFAKAAHGNVHHVQILAKGLDPLTMHTVTITPILGAGGGTELRFESLCVSGSADEIVTNDSGSAGVIRPYGVTIINGQPIHRPAGRQVK